MDPTKADALPTQDAPLISVALCTYNGERHLREQLDSVLAQRNVEIEIVALDDASSDGSYAMLQEYAARDPRIHCFQNDENLGSTRSFERAMSLARGDFIAPCDQDDVWELDKLAKVLAALGDADLAYCDSAYIDETGAFTGRKVSDDLEMIAGNEPLTFLFGNSVSGHATLLRRGVFETARPFPEDAFHDWWLALCAAAGRGIVYLPEPLVRFRRHAAAFSSLGRARKGGRRSTRNRRWLKERRPIMVAHARSTVHGHEQAQELLLVLDKARDSGRSGGLLRAVWQLRAALPDCRGGIPSRRGSVRNTVRWWFRFERRLRRARKEPVDNVDK